MSAEITKCAAKGDTAKNDADMAKDAGITTTMTMMTVKDRKSKVASKKGSLRYFVVGVQLIYLLPPFGDS